MRIRIYRPAKTAMQSGRGNTRMWIAEHEPAAPREADPLMGWVSSRDTLSQVKLRFATKEEAIAYAQRKGLDYVVQDEHDRKIRPKSYADNFRYDRVIG
ncbi:ETC complex I subunit [Telmatospirillum sp. J64-1]|uniref:ETC complex I subunit n=1 Tax=Telmatospirillum sp. J64-1 TaxID=2502183 RepID=UPI00115F6027|nr:ETC complex I subunit [Telmatospirillum sp. J64-1]